MIDFLQTNFENILAIIGGVVAIATAIVAITPSTKDNEILTKIVNVLEKLSLLNTKDNKEILNKNK